MDEFTHSMSHTGMTAVTSEQLADRAEFAELVDEDPRSYQRAVEHQATRTTSPIVRQTRGWSLTRLAEELDQADESA